MTKMTPLLIRLEPALVARLDEMRGDVPRVAFIRRRLAAMLDQVDPAKVDAVAAPARVRSPDKKPAVPTDKPFVSRLKGEWKPR